MAAAIEVESLTKTFRLYKEKPTSLKERVLKFKRLRYEHFTALRNINLDIEAGTTVGLLGHNGSGKSTLLKCIAGIIPTHRWAGPHCRPDGVPAGTRGRVPPRPLRAGERLPQRLDPRPQTGRRGPGVRRHRRVRRTRGFHRHAGQALLVRDVHPARLRRRHQRRPRDPPGRRGPLGRRRGLPAEVHRQGQDLPGRGPHDRGRHPRRRPRPPDVRQGRRPRARRDGGPWRAESGDPGVPGAPAEGRDTGRGHDPRSWPARRCRRCGVG